MLKGNKDIAPPSCQILQTFAYSLPISLYLLYKLIYICAIFATMLAIQRITLELGELLLPAVSMDICELVLLKTQSLDNAILEL